MTAVFIPFCQGPSDRPAWPAAVGALAGFADKKTHKHPDFTVTEIGDHADTVVTEIGDHPDFGGTPPVALRSIVPLWSSFPALLLKAGSLAPENFHPENKDLIAMRGVAAPPAPGQQEPPKKPPNAGQNRTNPTENRTEAGQDPDRNRTAPGQAPDSKTARPQGS